MVEFLENRFSQFIPEDWLEDMEWALCVIARALGELCEEYRLANEKWNYEDAKDGEAVGEAAIRLMALVYKRCEDVWAWDIEALEKKITERQFVPATLTDVVAAFGAVAKKENKTTMLNLYVTVADWFTGWQEERA